MDATQAAEGLVAHRGTFGIPNIIKHNHNPLLIEVIFQENIHILGSTSHRTMSNSKNENAIVERSNKEILQILRNFISGRRVIKSNSKYIPLVQRILNALLHK